MSEVIHPYSQTVKDTVSGLMGAHPFERLAIGEELGSTAILDLYEASCEALDLAPEVLLARAAELDQQDPDESIAAAERSYFGSLIANYESMYQVYSGDPGMTEDQAASRALGSLRQAYAERKYRLARMQDLSLPDYRQMLRHPTFGTSVRLVSLVTFNGHEQLSSGLQGRIPIAA